MVKILVNLKEDYMKTVVAIYTGHGLMEPLKEVFKENLPDCHLINIIDDSLISEVIKHGEVTQGVKQRLYQYYKIASDLGASAILNTCSSVGEVAEKSQDFFDIPIVRIDSLMAKEAVEKYSSVGVLATLPTTLNPTIRLLEKLATKHGKSIKLVHGLAEGAYEALVNGKPSEHDHILFKTAERLGKEADALILAQGSMARVEKKLFEKIGKPVLSSPQRGVTEIGKVLEAIK